MNPFTVEVILKERERELMENIRWRSRQPAGHNSDSIGICYVGGSDGEGNPKDTRTAEQKDSLVTLIKEILDRHADAEVFGHRDFSEKACPSFDARTEYAGL